MARNKVQFQKGLSTGEFLKRYGTEAQCHDALVKMRWPSGFVCPKCAETKHAYCVPRQVFQCRACRVQTSVRAGTIFHKSRTPLTKWFLAMHLLTASKNDIAALEMARQMDVKWDTAWTIKQKLMGSCCSGTRSTGSTATSRSTTPIRVEKRPENVGAERPTSSLS